jgi:hypothetical protein
MARFMTVGLAVLALCLGACRKGPGPSEAFMRYHQAFDQAKTVEEILPYMAREPRAKIEATDPKERARDFEILKMLQEVVDVEVVKEDVAGDKATLEAKGIAGSGGTSRGTITLVREPEGWKVQKEKWTTSSASSSGEKPACAQLEADLKSARPGARAQAAFRLQERAMGDSACVDAAPALLAALKDPVTGVRGNAATALGNLFRVDDETMKARAAKLSDVFPKLLAAKEEAARADDLITEMSLQNAVAGFGTPAIPTLVADLGRPARELRWKAAQALGRMGVAAQSALTAVEAALKVEQDDLTRKELAEAVRKLKG